MMHTDAGFYFLTEKQPAMPHLEEAEKLLARALSSAPGHWDFGRRWYRTVESVLKTYRSPGAQYFAKRFSDIWKARFAERPLSVRALDAFHNGVVNEYDGCQKGEFLTVGGLTEFGDNLVQRYFVPAARELALAMTLDPEMTDAALHLGRVRLLEGREREAVEYFDRAANAPSKPIAYTAKLFLGAIAERAGRRDAAEAAYRGAVRLFPAAQSGIVALAQLLDRHGKTAEAAVLLQTMLSVPERSPDPWSLYFEEAGADDAASIGLMRAEVIK
jgi:hypothetical protein